MEAHGRCPSRPIIGVLLRDPFVAAIADHPRGVVEIRVRGGRLRIAKGMRAIHISGPVTIARRVKGQSAGTIHERAHSIGAEEEVTAVPAILNGGASVGAGRVGGQTGGSGSLVAEIVGVIPDQRPRAALQRGNEAAAAGRLAGVEGVAFGVVWVRGVSRRCAGVGACEQVD